MADNTGGINLEVGGFADYVNSFKKVDEAHAAAGQSAEALITDFVNLQLKIQPIAVSLQSVASEVSSGLGISNLSASVNSLETTFISLGGVLNTTLQELLAFAKAPTISNIALPDISAPANVLISDVDRILAKLAELNAYNPTQFIQELLSIQDALASAIDIGGITATFNSLAKTLTSLKSVKGIDDVAVNIGKLVAAIQQFESVGTISTGTIDSLATSLPLFITALKKFDAKSISTIPQIVSQIGAAFGSFASIGNITANFPQFVTDFTNLGTVLKDLSSGKGATRLAEILKELAPAVNGLIQAFAGLQSGQLSTISNTFTEFGNALKEFGLGIKRVSEGGAIDVAIAGIQKLVTLLDRQINVNAFSAAFTTLSTTLKAFAEAIKTFTSGKSLDTLPQRIGIITTSLETLGKANLGAFASQLNIVAPALEKFSAALKILSSQQNLSVLLNNVDALSTAIGRSSFSFQAFTFIVEKLGGAIASGLGIAISAIGSFIAQLGSFIGSSIVSFIQGLIAAFISFGQTLTQIPFAVISGGFNLILKAIELILTPITAVISLFQGLGSILSTVFGGNKAATELQQTGTASQQLDSEIKTLNTDLQAYNTTANSAGNETQQLGNSFNEGNDKLFKFVSTLEAVKGVSGFLFNAFQQIRFGLVNIVGESFNAAVASEKLKTSLEALSARDLVKQGIFDDIGKSAGVAQQEAILLQNQIENLAIISPFSKESIAEGLKLGLTFGFTAQKALELTKATTDFVAATGQSGEVIGEIDNILGKLNTTGKLTSATANELAKRGINIRESLGTAFGKSQEEVTKLIRKGLVPANVAIKLVSDEMNVFKGAAAQTSTTLEGLISSAQDLKDKALRNLFAGVFEAFKPFGAAINEFLLSPELFKSVDELGNTIRDSLLGAVQSIAGPLGSVIQLFQSIPAPVFAVIKVIGEVAAVVVGVVAAFGAFNAILTVVGPIVGLFLNPLALTTAAIAGLSIVIYENIDAISAFVTQFEYLLPSTDSVNAALAGVGNALLSLFNFFVNIGSSVTTASNSFLTLLPTFSNVSTAILGILPTLQSLTSFFATNFGTIQQIVADNVNNIIQFLGDSLSNFAEFGSGLINAFAEGIISAISIVESAIAELGAAIGYLMAPGSPPRFLPDIDKWGTDTANVYLQAFSKADFGVISDFGSTLGDLLKSIGGDAVKNIKVKDIINTFSDAFANFKVTGSIDTSFFDQITQQAGAAGGAVTQLAQQFLDVATATAAADAAGKAYNDQVAKLQGTLDKLDASQAFTNEQQQLDALNAQLKSRFLNESQRKATLDQITRITAQRELRGLKDAQSTADDNLKTAQDALDVTKARLGLSTQFDTTTQTAAGGADGGDDAAKKAKKLKEGKGAALDLADAVEKAEQSIVKLSAAKVDTGPLENFKKSFQDGRDKITAAFKTIQNEFTNFKDNLAGLGITFDTVKKAAIGLGTVLATVFVVKNLAVLLPLLAQFAEPIGIVTAGLLAAGAAFLAFQVITNKIDLSKLIGQINGLIGQFNVFNKGRFQLPTLDTKVFVDGLLQVQNAIRVFQTSANSGNGKDLISNIFNFDTTSLSSIADSLGNIFNNITGIVSKFVTNLKSFSFGDLVGILLNSLKSLTQIPKVFADAFGSSSGILDGIKNGLIAVGKSLLSNNPFINIFQQLLAGIDFGNTSIVTDAIAKLFDFSGIQLPSIDLSGIFKNLTGIELPQIDLSKIFGNFTLPDFGAIFDSIVNSIPVKAFSEVGRIFTEFFTQISSSSAAKSLTDFANAAGFAFVEVGKVVGVLAGLAAVLVGGAIEQAPQIFFSLIDALTATFNFLGSFIKAFEDFFSRGSFSISSFVQLGIDLFHSFTNNIGQFFTGVSGFFDGFNKIIDNAIVILGNLFGFDAEAFLTKFRIPITIIETLITGKFLVGIFNIIKGFELFSASSGIVGKTLSILIAPFKLLISAFELAFSVISRLFKVLGVFNKNLVQLFTGTGKLQTFGNIFKDIFSIIKTGEPAFAGIGKQVTVLSKIFGSLGSIFKGAGSLISKAFSAIFSSGNATAIVGDTAVLEGAAGSIASNFIGTLGSLLVSGFSKLPVIIGTGIGLAIVGFQKFGPQILAFFTTTIPKLFKSISGLIISPKNSALIGNSFLTVFATVGKLLSFVFNNFGAIVKTLLNSSFVKQFVDGFKSIAPKVVAFIPTLIQNLVKFLTEGFVLLAGAAIAGLVLLVQTIVKNGPQILSTLGTVLVSVGGAIIQGLIDGIDAALAVVGIGPKAQEFVDSFLSVIQTGFAAIQPYLQPIIDKFGELVTFIGGLTFPNPFDDLIAVISGTEGIGDAITNISTEFGSLLTQITGLVFPNPFAEIGKVISGKENIADALANIITQFGSLITQLTGLTLPNPFAEIVKVFEGKESIGDAITNVGKQFAQLVLDVGALLFPDLFATIVTVMATVRDDITAVQTGFTNLVTYVTSITFPNPFAPLITFITGDGGIKTVLDTFAAAFKVTIDAITGTTIPNIFADLVSFVTGETGLIPTIQKISGEFTNLKTFLDTFVLPVVFQTIIDAISGDNGLIKLLSNVFDSFNTFQANLTGISLPNPFELIYQVLAGPGNISEKIDTLLTAFENLSAGIAKLTLLTVLDGLKVIIDGIKSSIDILQTGFTTLGTFLDSFGIPNPFAEIATVLETLKTGLSNLQTAFTDVQTFINGLNFTDPLATIKATLSATKDLIQPLTDSFQGLVDFFSNIKIPNPFDSLTIPDKVQTALKALGFDLGEETGSQVAEGVTTKASEELSNKDIKVTNSTTTLTNFKTAGEEAGTSYSDGATQGLDTAGKANEEETKSWFQSWIVDPLESAAGIQSPSKVADESIGQPIGQGILQGVLTALTAGESSLTDALNKLLASFETFKTSFISSASDLGTQLVSTFSGISTQLSSISFSAPTIKSASTSSATGDFSSQFTTKFTQIAQAFTTFKVALTANFIQLFTALTTTTDRYLKDILDIIETFFQDVLDDFDKFSQDLLAAQDKLNRDILAKLETLLDTILKRVEDFFDDFIALIEDSFATILDTIKTALDDIKNAFNTFFNDTITAINDFLGKVKAAFNGLATIFKDAANAAIKAFTDAITSGFANSVIPALVKAIQVAGASVQSEFSSVGSKLASNLIDGIKAGFNTSSGTDIGNAIVDLINRTIRYVNGKLQIGSPSKVFADEIGTPLAQGLPLGVDNFNPRILADSFISLIDTAIGTVKNKYGIRSPSDVMRKLIGNNLVHGIVKGVDELSPNVSKSFDRILGTLGQDLQVGNVKLGSIPNFNLPNLSQTLTQGIDTKYNGILSNLPDLTQKVNVVTDGLIGNINAFSNLTLPEKSSLKNITNRNSSLVNSTTIDKSLDMSTNRVVSVTNNKQYVMNMTVSPERATQVRRNFKVAEFLG